LAVCQSPTSFGVAARRKLPGGGRSAVIVINTYNTGNIPQPPANEPASHGYVQYKLKLKNKCKL